MSRMACILALGAVFLLSSCGVLRRFRTRGTVPVDRAQIGVLDTFRLQPDSPVVMGPLMDSGRVVTSNEIPELADDSKMAMPWWMQQLNYTTFSGKAKAHIESPEESRDFTLTVRIESGKKIWLSVVGSALGISMEAFRAVLTPDSMIAINRIDKEVIRAPFSEIGRLFPVQGDFAMLEAVLVGGRLPGVSTFQHLPDENDQLRVEGRAPFRKQSMSFQRSDSLLTEQILDETDVHTELGYQEYELVGYRRFARKRSIAVMSHMYGSQKLNLEYTSFSFDEPVDMTINIPEKYKQR